MSALVYVTAQPSTTPTTSSGVFSSTSKNAVSTAAQQAEQHAAAMVQAHNLAQAITALQPVWSPLPMGPYPPAGDTTSFPRSGTPNLIVSQASVSIAQRQEPGRVAKGLADQALARRPKVSPLFWVGLACLGAGIYLSRR